MQGKIILEDGTIFHGTSFGYEDLSGKALSIGEFVFNTSMSGYQEILTDPSYSQQIITMTYPLIGNYGINEQDVESNKVQVSGFIVKEYQNNYSNHRATCSLKEYLSDNKILAIQGVDTRKLTRHIREQGAMMGALCIGEWDDQVLLDKIQSAPKMAGRNLVDLVTTKEVYKFNPNQDKSFHVVTMDLGIKTNILRMLSARDCSVTVVPSNLSVKEILELKPDGIFLSNGPGDPSAVKNVIQSVKELISKKPIFGICLGHQILSIALGGNSYKLKFGHRGGNHPVKNILTGKIEITSQNHGFVVDESNIPSDVEITHINLNDNTVEGIRHKHLPIFSVQYHPESSPGPHDSAYLFDQFINYMK